jgi:hypothetical protein
LNVTVTCPQVQPLAPAIIELTTILAEVSKIEDSDTPFGAEVCLLVLQPGIDV